MRHTGRTLILALLIAGLLGSMVTGAAIYSRLVYLAVTVLVVSGVWALTALNGVSVTRRARSLRASVGDYFEEYYELENRSRLIRLWLEIANHSPVPGAAGSRLLTNVGRREKRAYTARTWLTRRGAFPLGPTVVSSGDPLGLFRRSRSFPARDSLLVLPKIIPLTHFPVVAGLLPGGRAIRQKSPHVTPHAAGVREYATGDPLKRIHWPSTARRNALMVKEFERDPQEQVWIFLDVQRTVHYEQPYQPPPVADWIFNRRPEISLPPDTLEYGVSISASLAHYFLNQRRAVGFVSAGQVLTVLQAERSQRQEIKILETLAFVKADGHMPLAGVVDAQLMQIASGSSVMLITSSSRADVLLAVRNLQRRSLHPLLILLDSQSFGGPSNGTLAQSIQSLGAPVCRVACGDDLSVVLGAFAARFTPKETQLWNQPSYTPST